MNKVKVMTDDELVGVIGTPDLYTQASVTSATAELRRRMTRRALTGETEAPAPSPKELPVTPTEGHIRDVHPALSELANDLSRLADAADMLREASGSRPGFRRQFEENILTAIAHHTERSRQISKDLAINAVLEGWVSRVRAGEILGVHQGTIARWVKEVQ